MTRRGGHWARYRVSVGIETAGFRPVKNPFRRDKRKTCRPRAISVTRCGSSSLSFWASKAVSVLIVHKCVGVLRKKWIDFPGGGKRYRKLRSYGQQVRSGWRPFPTLPGTLLGYGSIFPTAAATVSATTRCRRVNCTCSGRALGA